MPATPELKMPKILLGASHEQRLAAVVLDSPLLFGVLPAEELRELVTAYEGAEKALAEAAALPAEPDILDVAEAAFRAGEPVDPAALIAQVTPIADVFKEKRLGENNWEIVGVTPRNRVISTLKLLVERFKNRIIDLIGSYCDRYYEVLNENLEDILNRTEVVAPSLHGITSADAAIKASLAPEWGDLLKLTDEYAENRRMHESVLRNGSDFVTNPGALLRQRFAGIATVWPTYLTDSRTPDRDLMGNPVDRAPFRVFEIDSPAHLLTVTRDRETLMPFAGDGSTYVDGTTTSPGPTPEEMGFTIRGYDTQAAKLTLSRIADAGLERN